MLSKLLFPFALLLYFFLMQPFTYARQYTLAKDSAELSRLYHETGGNHWKRRTGWQTAELPVWSWYGISTEFEINGKDTVHRVTAINLPANNIRGELPALDMQYLKSLYLPGNFLKGSFPKCNLPALVTLYLAGNQMSGDINNITITTIKQLVISGNSFNGLIDFQHWRSLEMLDIGSNDFEGEFPAEIPATLSTIKAQDNRFFGRLPAFDSPALQDIDFSNNQFSGPLPEYIMPLLRNLNISNNELTGELPDFLLPALRRLNISNNKLSGEIPELNLPALQYLDLSDNQFSGTLYDFELPLLRQLDLSHNKLSGMPQLQDCPKLSSLIINNNRLTFGQLEQFTDIHEFVYAAQEISLNINPEDLGENEYILTVITDGDNNIYSWYRDSTKTDDLKGKSVSVSGGHFYYCIVSNPLLPELIYNSRELDPAEKFYALVSDSLMLVKLYNNTFGPDWKRNEGWLTKAFIQSWDGVEIDTVFIDGDSVIVVEAIELGNNNLSGELPDLNFARIKSVDLFNNKLSGSIPDFESDYIKNIDLSDNEFTGPLPNIVARELIWIDLSGNHLSGEMIVPQAIMLDMMDYSDNMLSGQLPDILLPMVSGIDLSDNSFTGKLPAFYTPQLIDLNLSSNELNKIGSNSTLNNLEWLDLEYNKFVFGELEPYTDIDFFYYGSQDTTPPLKIKWIGQAWEVKVLVDGSVNQYTWTKGQTIIKDHSPEFRIETDETGMYQCEISNLKLPDLILKSDAVDPKDIGIIELTDSRSVSVYPNPCGSCIYINSDLPPGAKIFAIDIRGNTWQLERIVSTDNGAECDVKGLCAGYYYLTVSYGNIELHSGFIKK